MDTNEEQPGTRNEITGDLGMSVQAGVVHGGVHIGAAPQATAPVPRQLPMAVPGFVNRHDQLAALDRLVPAAADNEAHPEGEGSGRAVVVSAVSGTPGVGKTALAVHWAHRMRHRYVEFSPKGASFLAAGRRGERCPRTLVKRASPDGVVSMRCRTTAPGSRK